jgi:segregation and condensation protein B
MARTSSRRTPAASVSEAPVAETEAEVSAPVAPPASENQDPELASAPVHGPGDQLSDDELLAALTALVYASPEPISMRRLLEILEQPARPRLAVAIGRLQASLAACGLPLELREIAGGFQILTKPEMGEVVQRLFKARRAERISSAALETLAVIAYRQPVSKAEIEAIRGVQAGPVLRSLVDRGLVRITGRADLPGQPLLYGTTKEFLERFGLSALGDLPRDGELNED